MGLGRIARDNVYTFVLRSQTCKYGPIKGVTADSLEVDVSPIFPSQTPQIIKLSRSEIVQVRDGFRPAPNDILYSGRNSWADVQSVSTALGRRESIHIALKSGGSASGKPKTATGTVLVMGKAIARVDVATVSYTRIKPIAAGPAWFAQEAGFLAVFDPQQWPYILNIGVHMSVRLYSATLAEDDSPVVCPQR